MSLRFLSLCSSSLVALTVLSGAMICRAQLPAEEELKHLRAANGLELSLFAAEPLLTNPAAIDVDTHGRVWVAEIQFYRRFADKPPADKIKVLEDTDGDGRADRATVFAEGVYCPMSICVAGPKVYVATSPDLWVFEDQNGDLRADGPPKKLLTGFGGYNHDHGAHSLVLGPDHKWWMSHGDGGFEVTGVDGSRAQSRWGGVLRGELDGSKLEVVATNFRNPYEVCVSSFGEAFLSDNDNDGNQSARICWILEGGDYGWFGQPGAKVPPGTPFGEGWHFRAYTLGYVPATLVTGFGSPAGICFYEGDAFGAALKNVPWHCDPGPREVRAYPHQSHGFGMQADSRVLVTSQGDDYFRPDDVCAAPDGTLYLADWYDGGVGGHAYNNPDQGRIFRIAPAGGVKPRREQPGPYDNIDDAILGLQSPNLATQFLAREYLLSAGEKSLAALDKLASDSDANNRARALWVLDRLGGAARDRVVDSLKHDDVALRALAARILRRHGDKFAMQLAPLADDPAAEVRREVLLATRFWHDPLGLETLARLAASYDGSDRYQLEAIHIAAANRRSQLYAALDQRGAWPLATLPLMQLLDAARASKLVLARLADRSLAPADRLEVLRAVATLPTSDAALTVLATAADIQAPIELRTEAIVFLERNLPESWKILDDALAGTSVASSRNIAAVDIERAIAAFNRLLSDESFGPHALSLVAQRGWLHFRPSIEKLAGATAEPIALRVKAIQTLARLGGEQANAAVTEHLHDTNGELRRAALAAAIHLQAWPALKQLLRDSSVADEVKRDVAEQMLATPGGALVLLRMIDAEQLPTKLTDEVVTRAVEHADINVRVLFERFVPEERRPKRLGEAIKAADILKLAADKERGQNIFFESSATQCKNCHTVHGRGGTLGPDLSQIGRKYERAALLETILDPSKAIAPEYVPHVLETTTGQVYVGLMLENSSESVLLVDAQNQTIRVPKSEIVALEPQAKSLMPELALRDVSAQDAADLLAFLASLTDAVQPVTRFRILGPFDAGDGRGHTKAYAPEKQLASIDPPAEYDGLDGRRLRWETVTADNGSGFWSHDLVEYGKRHGLRGDRVVYYYLVTIDSPAAQPAQLSVDSDDNCRVWLNGQAIHEYVGRRALGSPDRIDVQLSEGRNTLIVKVENLGGPGGVAISVSSRSTLRVN
ncbi:MAG: c-type cytochrome [Pirellulales bacterium]|nr:c-type cytochrome [Pirellulales bacterium]